MKTSCLLLLVLITGWRAPLAAQQLPRALRPPRPAAALPALRPAATTAARPQQIVRYGWNAGQAAWTQPLLDRLQYTPQAQLAERVTADSATATAFQREANTYDAQGNLLTNVQQTGNGTPWMNEFRYQYTYDAQQQLTEQLNQTWTNGTWQTTDGYRYLNTYAGPVLTQQVVQLYKAGAFVDDLRFQYQLSNNQWTESLAQRWNGTSWVNEERLVDLTWRDWDARQPASFRVQAWQNPGQWVDFQRHTLSYSPTGTVVQLMEEATPGGWQNFMRYTQPLDAQGNSTGYRQEDWANGTWVLSSELRAQLRYDAQNRLTRRTEQLYVPLTAQFVNRQRLNYGNFLTVTPTLPARPAAALRLYPQPATDVLYLEASNLPQQVVTVEIRAVTGQLVQRFNAQPQAGTLQLRLPLSGLVPGWFSLHLLTGRGTIVQPFIHQ